MDMPVIRFELDGDTIEMRFDFQGDEYALSTKTNLASVGSKVQLLIRSARATISMLADEPLHGAGLPEGK